MDRANTFYNISSLQTVFTKHEKKKNIGHTLIESFLDYFLHQMSKHCHKLKKNEKKKRLPLISFNFNT